MNEPSIWITEKNVLNWLPSARVGDNVRIGDGPKCFRIVSVEGEIVVIRCTTCDELIEWTPRDGLYSGQVIRSGYETLH